MATCTWCKGNGRCKECGGTGDGKKVVSHPSQGLVNSETGTVKCPACDGRGRCSACDGTGKD